LAFPWRGWYPFSFRNPSASWALIKEKSGFRTILTLHLRRSKHYSEEKGKTLTSERRASERLSSGHRNLPFKRWAGRKTQSRFSKTLGVRGQRIVSFGGEFMGNQHKVGTRQAHI